MSHTELLDRILYTYANYPITEPNMTDLIPSVEDANKPLSKQSNIELLEGLPELAKDCTFETLTREQTLRFMEYMRRQCSKQHPACYDTQLTTEWLPKLLNKLWEEET